MNYISRRNFIRKSGVTLTSGLIAGQIPAMEKSLPVLSSQAATGGVPLDKNLDPAWMKSQYEHGVQTVYAKSRNELRYIVPVGGINGGGRIIREMASGTGRLDICLIYENQKYPIVLKIRYGKKYLEEGLKQIVRYADLHCCNEGWMVVFDRRSTVNWQDKLYMKKESVNGKTITIVGV
ncbi:MAG: hypothetical protein LBF89_07155 [Bacteroidales bacterium]|nr:hypothetical protein [Bacteroidales bacterium]